MGLSNIFLCLTCVIISGILCYTYVHTNNTKDLLSRLYICFVNELELFCINEMVSSLRLIIPNFPPIISMITFSLFYLIESFIFLTWMLYIFTYFKGSFVKNMPIVILAAFLFFIVFVLLIINLFYPFVFTVSDEGNFINLEYGLLTIAPEYLLSFCIVMYTLSKFFKEKNQLIRRRHLGVALFAVIPFIYAVIQVVFADLSLNVVGFTLAVLVIYIYNVSKQSEDEFVLQKSLQQEVISKSLDVMYEYNSIEAAVEKILGLIAHYYEGEVAYIYEINQRDNYYSNLYYWSLKGLGQNRPGEQKLPLEYIKDWVDVFERRDEHVIYSVEQELDKKSPMYRALSVSGVNNIMVVPLRDNGVIVGFIGVSNVKKYQNDFSVLHAISSIAYSELLRRKHNKRDDEVIKILSSEYSCVLYAELPEGNIIPYEMDEKAKEDYGSLIEKGISIERILKIYIDRDVFEEDKEKLHKQITVPNIQKQLSDKKSFNIIFRKESQGTPIYDQVSFIKIDDIDEPATEIAIGFANKTEEVIGNLVNHHLLESYASIYYINFEDNSIRAYKQSVTMEVGRFSAVLPYDVVVNAFAEDVNDEYKMFWHNMANIKTAQEFLMDENSREIVYEVKSLENPVRRALWKVIDRKDGVPMTVIVGFMGVDKQASAEIELNNKIHEQKEALESQAILLENALRQAQVANEAKSAFLSTMSHDIRTPMNAIMGFTELALQNLDNKEKIKEYMLKSNVSSQHLLSLINDILDMNKIERGKFKLNVDACSIHELVTDAQTILHGMASSKNQYMILEKLDIKDEYVYCDKLRINQVVINLLSNAIKFTPENGKISVSVVQKSSKDGFGEYEFKVTDNGIGMSKEFVKKIFFPFEREDTSEVAKSQGTGLGMSITKNIVDMMGGTIDVESEEGKGSTFTVIFNVKLAESVTPAEKKPSYDEKDFKGKRILVVEDNEMNREIAIEILKESGFEVESAEDGKYAVEMVKKSKPGYYDVVLMDIMMPLLNGYEATKAIRGLSNQKLANIPIIAMTANAFDDDKKEAFEAGMNEHIAKPISIDILLKTIANYI